VDAVSGLLVGFSYHGFTKVVSTSGRTLSPSLPLAFSLIFPSQAAVQVGDVFALLIEYFYSTSDFEQVCIQVHAECAYDVKGEAL
jgi:hypothetical protein